VNTHLEDYQQQLLLALRLRNVSGPRIAEALAEVDSHVSETGEDAYQAFGAPKDYADQIAGALGSTDALSWRSIFRSMTWRDGVTFLAFVVGSTLVFLGIFDLAAGEFRWLSTAAIIAGLGMLAAAVIWVVRRVRTSADRVLDPRTGRDMAPSMPRWTVIVWACYPAILLLVAYLSGVSDH
jgi:hypothetical protein